MNTRAIDSSNMCSHLQKKLFEDEGAYHGLWTAIQNDPELTAVVRSRLFLANSTCKYDD